MKKSVYLFTILLLLIVVSSGCYDRDIIESKNGISLPMVSNLQAVRSGTSATVTWTFPSDIPDEFNRPLIVNIQVFENNMRLQILEEANEVSTYTVTGLEVGKTYRIIVKLRGNFKEPVYGETNNVYSLGQVVTVE